ncbi:MerR family transcriptional regulator [Thioclava sp. A2]|uniref:MerR family transcriptional regulator n=1 Tax=Thioclava sp. FCG-A2 TaxID=3080562 RepID=UPI0029539D70|nr:MerR family transcriptional regulator [Thioclava sp. A2]MDV7269574.1 MerR family transcriptional regulator [Thioclava sp. A2]
MAKSADAFRTISEVSELLDVPTHVLRFWESRFTQIKPVKRAGGRRYYRPADVELIAGIRKLLHEDGMPIREAQKLLKAEGVRHVAALGNLEGDAIPPAATTPEPPAMPAPDLSPQWPESATPEPETAQDSPFPPDPEDLPEQDAPVSAGNWSQPSLFGEDAPEAPMAEDVSHEAAPRSEVVSLKLTKPAPKEKAAPTTGNRLRALTPDLFDAAGIETLRAQKKRLSALHDRLLAPPQQLQD